jgi:hypothetical protein
MSRSGYIDDIDTWPFIKWRGAVESAIRGKRGQVFFKDLLAALDAMPVKRLIANDLVKEGEVCALGALGVKREIDMTNLDSEDHETVSRKFDIADALAREVVFVNDEGAYHTETSEMRFERVRKWVLMQIPKEDQYEQV